MNGAEKTLTDIQKSYAEKRFVAYGPHLGKAHVERQRALSDIRDLIRRYGDIAAWLWDPFLSADDLLETLFFCPHSCSDLRGLTGAGNNVDWIKSQFDRLTAAKGNTYALRLEYRVKTGPKGWSFHDRFLIFPRVRGGALAWSLGTSVNSLGQRHHILQQVSDGQMIADAFQELWLALDEPQHVIWKTP